jgi:hypothetical protein
MEKKDGIGCPKCLSRDICQSRRQSVLDHIAGFLLLSPVRCRSCCKRFWLSAASVASVPKGPKDAVPTKAG